MGANLAGLALLTLGLFGVSPPLCSGTRLALVCLMLGTPAVMAMHVGMMLLPGAALVLIGTHRLSSRRLVRP